MGLDPFPARRRHPAYETTDPPPSFPSPPPVPDGSAFARAARTPLARLLVMIAAAATGVSGVVAATGAAVVNVINATGEANARRSNAEIDRRLEAVEVRVNADFGLPLETKTRQEKDAEIAATVDRLRADLAEVESRTPAVKRRPR